MVFSTGCITHYVMDEYPQYLQKNEGKLDLPKINTKLSYAMDEPSDKHIKKIQAVSTGWAHKWMIEFGKTLRATMNSTDVNKAFKKITYDKNKSGPLHIDFAVKEFDFREAKAHINVDATVSKKGKQILSKNYTEVGIGQGGKMFWAGAFGMKNAIHQSTKAAMDTLMKRLVEDIKVAANKPST